MMTLEEAIQHCKEKACGNSECAAEHRQLAQWLTELKTLKELLYKEDVDEASLEYANKKAGITKGAEFRVKNKKQFDWEDIQDAFEDGVLWFFQLIMRTAVSCGGDGWFLNGKRNCRKNGRFHKYYVSTITHDNPLPMDNGKNYKLIVIEDEDR